MKDVEIVVFNDKSWVRFTEYQKVKEENESLQQKWLESEYEKSKLVSQIEKLKCCANCTHGKQGERDCCGECYYCNGDMCMCDVTGDLMHWKNNSCENWECAYKEAEE